MVVFSREQTLQLLYRLIKRDLHVRYKVAVLGFFWSLLKPLALWAVFYGVFGVLMRDTREMLVEYEGSVPYGVWLLAGLFAWMYFAQAVNDASVSLLGNAYIMGKVAMPKWVLPVSAVGANLFNFLLSWVVMTVVLVFFGVRPTASYVLLPLVVLVHTLCALAIGLLTSVLVVMFRDVSMVLEVLLTAWFYFTPIFYPLALVKNFGDGQYLWLYLSNPMVSVVYSYQRILFASQTAPESLTLSFSGWLSALGVSGVMGALGLGVAVLVYRRFSGELVDAL